MPIKKSAIKRAKQNIVRRDKNRALKKTFRESVKSITKDIRAKKTGETAKTLSQTYAALDKAAKTNAIHKNAAARRKSRIAKKINAALGKPVVAVSAKAKQENTARPDKKPTEKKTPAKKKAEKK